MRRQPKELSPEEEYIFSKWDSNEKYLPRDLSAFKYGKLVEFTCILCKEAHVIECNIIHKDNCEIKKYWEIKQKKEEGLYDCATCGGWISYEHGGVVCVCGELFCCDTDCISEHYYSKKDLGHSVEIESCYKCDSIAEKTHEQ